MKRCQTGVSLLFVVIVLIGAMAVLLAILALFRVSAGGAKSSEAAATLSAITTALEQYVSNNGRLPCPAKPTLDTGDGDPIMPNANCNSQTGTVPWKTIGLRREDAIDPWGWKISYRVYSNVAGSLTQDNGASMVLCDTSVRSDPGLTAGQLCQSVADWHTDQNDFLNPPGLLNGKGLPVTDFGTAHLGGIAFVLISHGPSGLGAYAPNGTPNASPTNSAELNNTRAAGPFTAQTASRAGVQPDDPTHFDDVISFETISELARRANVGARDWPDGVVAPPVVGDTMTNAKVAAALGHGVSVGDVGTNSINFGSGANRARVRGFQSGSNTDISFNTTGGADSLGVAGAGNNLLSSVNSDKLRIDFQQDVFKLGVALADFGTSAGDTEQVQFRFSRGTGPGATTVTIVKSGCRADGGVATFSIDPGTDFERVEISPLAALPSGVTQFGVADFQVCGSSPGSCVSALATPSTACP